MGPPMVAQRLNQLEEKARAVDEVMADMITKAVEIFVTTMK